jgi:phosphatidylglycerol---prolipoprotein diacylglyceryl transferase
MNFPINIRFGSFEISSHLIFELLAYTIGFRYFLWLRKRQSDSISSDNRMVLLIAAATGAFIFSRLIGFLENPDSWKDEFTLHQLFGNKTILGGLFGGLLAVELCKKIMGIKKSSGDLMTFPLLLAMIIGRMGCFLAGLEDGTYGIQSDLPWAIDFGDHVRRHPTNLYEMLFLALLWIFLKVLETKYKLADGARFKIFLSGYFIFRLIVEFIKPAYRFDFGLSTIQITALVGILYYYKLFLKPSSLILKPAYA